MKQYKVEITETLCKQIMVEAKNSEEAIKIAESKYKAAEPDYILDYSDFVDHTIEIAED